MKTVLFKLDESAFEETEKILFQKKSTWNIYMNEALCNYNKYQKKLILGKKLKKESEMVKADCLKILKDFEGSYYED